METSFKVKEIIPLSSRQREFLRDHEVQARSETAETGQIKLDI